MRKRIERSCEPKTDREMCDLKTYRVLFVSKRIERYCEPKTDRVVC